MFSERSYFSNYGTQHVVLTGAPQYMHDYMQLTAYTHSINCTNVCRYAQQPYKVMMAAVQHHVHSKQSFKTSYTDKNCTPGCRVPVAGYVL